MLPQQDRTSAAETFIRILISHVREGVVQDMLNLLEKRMPGLAPPPNKLALHSWYQQLDINSQQHIHEIIREAVDSTLFSTLVILDGSAGGYPVKDKLSDFAIYLQIYQDKEARSVDKPQVSIRINPTGATEDLHDMFSWFLHGEQQS
jgi:hypothetical protein